MSAPQLDQIEPEAPLNTSAVAAKIGVSNNTLYRLIKSGVAAPQRLASSRYVWTTQDLEKVQAHLLSQKSSKGGRTRQNKNAPRQSYINNRRYLGNKHSISDFIRSTIDAHCTDVEVVADVFSGTGAVSNAFRDKTLITNDILYSNYLSNYAWLAPTTYDADKITKYTAELNALPSTEDNYMRKNFADTFFSADDCSKIGAARERVNQLHKSGSINTREFAILVTSVVYGMDRSANTVGHYDAYRQGVTSRTELVFPLILPELDNQPKNRSFNEDANGLVKKITCDVLYLDPPYNSRQYSDAYHLLENVARWEKPEVFGVAKKMDRTNLKSDYSTTKAPQAFADLVRNANCRYIVLSYNNMASKGNGRSNAKITDEEIISILSTRGDVQVFEMAHRPFSTGKSQISNNKERLFICTVRGPKRPTTFVNGPLNYTGGKFKLLPQLAPHFPSTSNFVDLFAGGASVGLNSTAPSVVFNDNNPQLVGLLQTLATTPYATTLARIEEIIEEFGLSNSGEHGYGFYGAQSAQGLAEFNKAPYLKLRQTYNDTVTRGTPDIFKLYALIIFGFNNQIRFNKQGHFNLPVGKRDFNAQMRAKLQDFTRALSTKKAEFRVGSFADFPLTDLPQDTFFYCDPPYLITTASYNESGNWTEQHELELLEFLNTLDAKGFRFALSNVTSAKGQHNKILTDWVTKHGYHLHNLEMNYSNSNYQRQHRATASTEVLITNYKEL